jgi:hypothetical protein
VVDGATRGAGGGRGGVWLDCVRALIRAEALSPRTAPPRPCAPHAIGPTLNAQDMYYASLYRILAVYAWPVQRVGIADMPCARQEASLALTT